MPKNNKVEDKSIKKEKTGMEREYHFPTLGKTIRATSLEEAQKKVNINKSNK